MMILTQLYYGAPYDQAENPVQLRALIEADKESSDLTGSEQEADYIVEQVKISSKIDKFTI